MVSDYPWKGAAHPLEPDAFGGASDYLGCEPEALAAVWDVEAAGRCFLKDGTIIRRFEPHHMPGSTLSWRDSLRIGPARREKLFLEAWERNPDAALRATSWGAPQIMGFNAEDAGYQTAEEMVEDMALAGARQLGAFIKLVDTWNLDSALRAHDWHEFARRYNGSGQPEVYARKIEAAYRRRTGKKSPTVIRVGSRGEAVRRLQKALGVKVDGAFGPATEMAVRDFQRENGLEVDGIAGKQTWTAIENSRDVKPKPQLTLADTMSSKGLDLAIKGGTGFGAGRVGEAVLDRAPDGAVVALTYGLVIIALIIASALAFKWIRDT